MLEEKGGGRRGALAGVEASRAAIAGEGCGRRGGVGAGSGGRVWAEGESRRGLSIPGALGDAVASSKQSVHAFRTSCW